MAGNVNRRSLKNTKAGMKDNKQQWQYFEDNSEYYTHQYRTWSPCDVEVDDEAVPSNEEV